MARSTTLYWTVALALTWLASAVHSAPLSAPQRASQPIPGRYVVELVVPPALEGGSTDVVLASQTALLDFMKASNITYVSLEPLNPKIWSGMVITFKDPSRAQEVAAHPTVKQLWPVKLEPVLPPTPQPDDLVPASAVQRRDQLQKRADAPMPGNMEHYLAGIEQVRNELKLTGLAMKVGVIDTGIDYTHPAFGACSSIGGNCRVQFGYDFVGDSIANPKPDSDPRDCQGHGTHVAGIIGGYDPAAKFTGVAPNVTLGAYKVFGCSGGARTDHILMAIQKAYDDGMDVINMSLGSDSGFPSGPEEVLIDRLTRLGNVIFVIAAGNSGSFGYGLVAGPSVSSTALSVAAVLNAPAVPLRPLTTSLSPSVTRHYRFVGPDPVLTLPAGGVEALANAKNLSMPADGCDAVRADAKGKVVLVARGGCVSTVKAANAQKVGAAALIVVNNAYTSDIVLVEDRSMNISIPVLAVEKEEGTALFEEVVKNRKVTLAFGKDISFEMAPTSNMVTGFSSWGLGPDLNIKPDISAPGNRIISTVPLSAASTGYMAQSGTSMASPLVAGAAALYLQNARATNQPTTSQALIEAFQNNALPAKSRSATAGSLLDTVALQGAGMIQLHRAITSTTRISPSRLVIGAFDKAAVFNVTLRNTNPTTAVSYLLGHDAASSVDVTKSSTPLYTGTGSKLMYSLKYGTERTDFTDDAFPVTVPANTALTVYIRTVPDSRAVALHAAEQRTFVSSGYLTFTRIPLPNTTSIVPPETFRIPFAGMVGSPKDLAVFETVAARITAGKVEIPPLPSLQHPPDRTNANTTYATDSTSPTPLVVRAFNITDPTTYIRWNLRVLSPLAWIAANLVELTPTPNGTDPYAAKTLGQAFNFTEIPRNRDDVSNPDAYFYTVDWEATYLHRRINRTMSLVPNTVYRLEVDYGFTRSLGAQARQTAVRRAWVSAPIYFLPNSSVVIPGAGSGPAAPEDGSLNAGAFVAPSMASAAVALGGSLDVTWRWVGEAAGKGVIRVHRGYPSKDVQGVVLGEVDLAAGKFAWSKVPNTLGSGVFRFVVTNGKEYLRSDWITIGDSDPCRAISTLSVAPHNLIVPCLDTIPYDADAAILQIEALKAQVRQYVFLDPVSGTRTSENDYTLDLVAELTALSRRVFPNDRAFHDAIYALFNRLRDNVTGYRSYCSHLGATFYQPLVLGAADTNATSQRLVVLDSPFSTTILPAVNELFSIYDTFPRYNGWDVVSIDGKDPVEQVKAFAEDPLGPFAPMASPAARFANALGRRSIRPVNGNFGNGIIVGDFAVRYRAPERSTVTYVLQNPATGETKEVMAPWGVVNVMNGVVSKEDLASRCVPSALSSRRRRSLEGRLSRRAGPVSILGNPFTESSSPFWFTEKLITDDTVEPEAYFGRSTQRLTEGVEVLPATALAVATDAAPAAGASAFELVYSSGSLGFYVDRSTGTGVARFAAFSASILLSFLTDALTGFNKLKENGATKLIIDLTDADGSTTCLGTGLLRYFLPTTPVTTLNPFLDHRATQLTQALGAAVGPNRNNIFSYTRYLDPATNRTATSASFFANTVLRARGAKPAMNYTTPAQLDCSSYVARITSSSPWDVAKDVAVVSNGVCLGPCAIFTRGLKDIGGAKMFTTSGTSSNPGPFSQIPGGEGITTAQLFIHVDRYVNSLSYLFPPVPYPTNMRIAPVEVYRSPVTPDSTPMYFDPRQADQKVLVSAAAARDPMLVWQEVRKNMA
ncbi:hypothetical protein HDU96_005938 [Phlyctochytrium bullatum]|nr:hypothetical protein HDU96_005938 [Phlyctochytrium bullatum]